METQSYIKALVTPQAKKANSARKVWSIDLETVWLPFFTATNVMGDTAIPSEAIGAPIRLAYNQDGTVKFSKTGRPITKVVKELSDNVRMVRDNFTAGLTAYANGVALENPDGFKAEVVKACEAGTPIVAHDNAKLTEAIAKVTAEAVEADLKAKAKAEAKAPKAKEAKAPKAPKTPRAPKVPRASEQDAEISHETVKDAEPQKEPVLVS